MGNYRKRARQASGFVRTVRRAYQAGSRVMTGAAAGAAAAAGVRYSRRGGSGTGLGNVAQRAAAAKKRSAGGAGTITRRKRRTKDAGNMSDYSKVTCNYGRDLSALMRTMRIVGGNTEKTKWSFRALNKFGGTQGKASLKSIQTGLTGTAIYMPLHIYDLTCVNNSNSGTPIFPTIGNHLKFSTELDAIASTPVQAQWEAIYQDLGSSNGAWIANTGPSGDTVVPTAVTGQIEGGNAFLDYVSVKLLLYGATAQPNKFLIELIQITKDDLVPNPEAVQAAGVPTQLHTAFWQYMSKRFCYNPIDTNNTNMRRYYKVLKSLTVEFDPKESSETSTNRYKEVRMFLKMNRKLDYRWKEDDLIAMSTGDTQKNLASNQCYVHPRARVFLMIRALNPFQGPSATSTAANTPTYDIVLDKVHRNLNPY